MLVFPDGNKSTDIHKDFQPAQLEEFLTPIKQFTCLANGNTSLTLSRYWAQATGVDIGPFAPVITEGSQTLVPLPQSDGFFLMLLIYV